MLTAPLLLKKPAELERVVWPCLTVTFPFEPKMVTRQRLGEQVSRILQKSEIALKEAYGEVPSIAIRRRLRALLRKLNDHTFTSSVLIHLSPVTEKVHYLNTPVTESVFAGVPFDVRSAVNTKKGPDFFVLLLIESHAVLFSW